jgi:hypothetical protein
MAKRLSRRRAKFNWSRTPDQPRLKRKQMPLRKQGQWERQHCGVLANRMNRNTILPRGR